MHIYFLLREAIFSRNYEVYHILPHFSIIIAIFPKIPFFQARMGTCEQREIPPATGSVTGGKDYRRFSMGLEDGDEETHI